MRGRLGGKVASHGRLIGMSHSAHANRSANRATFVVALAGRHDLRLVEHYALVVPPRCRLVERDA
jgi:hypothetical protein